jgi:hypothetical protein
MIYLRRFQITSDAHLVNAVIANRGVVKVMVGDWRGVASMLLRHGVSNAA